MEDTYLFKIIESVLNGNQLSLELNNDDLRRLLYISKEQSLLPYIYYATKDKRFENFTLGALVLDTKFSSLENELDDFFNKNNIRHFYLKGTIIKDLYPQTYLRTRGDIDVVVDKTDYKKVIKLLLNEGYKKTDDKEPHHTEFLKDNMMFEVHTGILFEDNKILDNYFGKYDNNLEKVNETRYKLDDTFHLVYVISHFSRHICEGGAGVRPLIDIYLCLTKTNINKELLIEDLKQLGLYKLFNMVLNCLSTYFSYNEMKFEKVNINVFVDFLIKCGIHGLSSENNREANNMARKKQSKIRYIFGKIFPKYSFMKTKYPYTKFVLLLPIGYIHRLIKGIFVDRRKISEVTSVTDNKTKELENMFETIGL